MPAPTTTSSVGLRYLQMLELNTDDHSPKATAAAWNYGRQLEGVNSLELTIPESRTIIVKGDDKVTTVFLLPPEEVIKGEIKASKLQGPAVTTMTGAKESTVGKMKVQAFATEKQGKEKDVCIIGTQIAQDTAYGSAEFSAERWLSYLVPLAKLVPKPGSMTPEANQTGYTLQGRPTRVWPWGLALSEATDGALETQLATLKTINHPVIAAALGDGTETEFLFAADMQAVDTDSITLYSNAGGTWAAVSAGITKAVTGITYTTAPASGVRLVVVYEYL